MRSILTLGLAAFAALVAGCQVVGYAGNPNFDNPFVNDTIGPQELYFPSVLKFPDETMFFFAMYDGAPRSDLELLSIRCGADQGHLIIRARLENQGKDAVAPDWFRSGELSAVRVAALITTADGAQERVDTSSAQVLTVAGIIDMDLGPTQALASDVVRVDVVADPNRVVPDPLRDNNVLSWQGSMNTAAQCDMSR
jgi:hypothetical protein